MSMIEQKTDLKIDHFTPELKKALEDDYQCLELFTETLNKHVPKTELESLSALEAQLFSLEKCLIEIFKKSKHSNYRVMMTRTLALIVMRGIRISSIRKKLKTQGNNMLDEIIGFWNLKDKPESSSDLTLGRFGQCLGHELARVVICMYNYKPSWIRIPGGRVDGLPIYFHNGFTTILAAQAGLGELQKTYLKKQEAVFRSAPNKANKAWKESGEEAQAKQRDTIYKAQMASPLNRPSLVSKWNKELQELSKAFESGDLDYLTMSVIPEPSKPKLPVGPEIPTRNLSEIKNFFKSFVIKVPKSEDIKGPKDEDLRSLGLTRKSFERMPNIIQATSQLFAKLGPEMIKIFSRQTLGNDICEERIQTIADELPINEECLKKLSELIEIKEFELKFDSKDLVMLARISSVYPDTEFPMGILSNNWKFKGELVGSAEDFEEMANMTKPDFKKLKSSAKITKKFTAKSWLEKFGSDALKRLSEANQGNMSMPYSKVMLNSYGNFVNQFKNPQDLKFQDLYDKLGFDLDHKGLTSSTAVQVITSELILHMGSESGENTDKTEDDQSGDEN